MTDRYSIGTWLKYFVCLSVAFAFLLISYELGYCQTDVSNLVKLNYARAARTSLTTSAYNVSITNISKEVLISPLKVVIDSISTSTVTVANADGTTEDGKPYFLYDAELSDGNLIPSEVSTQKKWVFNNPQLVRFSFATKVLGSIFSDPEIVRSEIANDLRAGDIEGALEGFEPSEKSQVVIPALDTAGRTQLADWIEKAELVKERDNSRTYRYAWTNESGENFVEFTMTKNDTGKWIITSW